MPFIREYWGEEVGTESTFVTSPRELPMHVALHETVHIVIGRLDGLDVADVIDQDDATCGILHGSMPRCCPCDRPDAHIVGRDRATPVAGSADGICGQSREATSPDHDNACPLATKPDRRSSVEGMASGLMEG